MPGERFMIQEILYAWWETPSQCRRVDSPELQPFYRLTWYNLLYPVCSQNTGGTNRNLEQGYRFII